MFSEAQKYRAMQLYSDLVDNCWQMAEDADKGKLLSANYISLKLSGIGRIIKNQFGDFENFTTCLADIDDPDLTRAVSDKITDR